MLMQYQQFKKITKTVSIFKNSCSKVLLVVSLFEKFNVYEQGLLNFTFLYQNTCFVSLVNKKILITL